MLHATCNGMLHQKISVSLVIKNAQAARIDFLPGRTR